MSLRRLHRRVAEDPSLDGPFTATFLDGPLCDERHDRHFMAGPPSQEMWLAPHPAQEGLYMFVGLDGFPPVEPWPGQVHYRLAVIGDAGGEPVAYYQQERA